MVNFVQKMSIGPLGGEGIKKPISLAFMDQVSWFSSI